MPELTLLGRYEVEMLLGTGHYAEVYRARDKVLNRQVALKVLKTGLGADDKVVAHFIREARALASLMHPRVCWVWDLGEAQGRHFIAMRLVDGQSLDRLIKQRGSLPWEEALEICLQAAEGLHYAHQKNMVHRDVKPQNILVSPTEGAVLSDFGLVKVFSESTQSSTMAAVGTPAYMAPEAWRDEQVGPPADQYALACVLVEMLTARPLFAGDSAPSVMTRHIMDAPELPKSWPSDVPAGLAACLQRALAKQPAARYPDLPAFVQALRGLSVPAIIPPIKTFPAQSSAEKLAETGRFLRSEPTRQLDMILVPGVMMEFVRVPAGEFLMGSASEKGWPANPDEVPQHTIYLDEYLIGKYPVTNRQFDAYVKDQKINWSMPRGKEDHPLVNVSWLYAHSFCEWVSRVTSMPVRLPSEAQWEKAARGTDGRIHPWGFYESMNHKRASYERSSTTPVGKYSPLGDSPYGCCDMLGNVWEWCSDWYEAEYYKKSPAKNPAGPALGQYRVMRGGSWADYASTLRCARRVCTQPANSGAQIGFRCVRVIFPHQGSK